MFEGLLQNAIEQIRVAEAFIDSGDSFAKAQPLEHQGPYRVFAVSSCVTRLYAIYEHFVESLISDFLDALPEIVPYASLPEGLKTEYRFGVSHVLSRIDSERYAHLKHENVIKWYHEALTNAANYRFVVEALTRHDQNLRLNVVSDLMARVGLKDFQGWLSRSAEVLALYEEKSSVFEQLAAELRAFVQIRNDAAHGVLEDLQGKEVLQRYCALIHACLLSVTAFVYRSLLQKKENAGRVVRIGRVTEVFERSGAFIAVLGSGCNVSRGDTLHFAGTSFCVGLNVQSLQLNDVDVDQVTASSDGLEVGVKCQSLPKRNSYIYADVA